MKSLPIPDVQVIVVPRIRGDILNLRVIKPNCLRIWIGLCTSASGIFGPPERGKASGFAAADTTVLSQVWIETLQEKNAQPSATVADLTEQLA